MNFRDIEQKILNGQKLTEEDESYIVKKVEEYWVKHPDVIYKFPRWKKILAWIAGYQYVDYNRIRKQIQVVPQIKRRVVINRLKPILRQMLAKIKTTVPELGVIPNTREYEDIAAAKVGDSILEALSNKIKFRRIRKDFFSWLLTIGRACIRVYWDETKKGIVSYERVVDEKTNIATTIAVEVTGDVAMDVVSPFNYRADPLYSNPEKWRWFLYGETVDRQALADAYNIPVDELAVESQLAIDTLYVPTAVSLDEEDGGLTSPPVSETDTCFRYELWTPNMYIIVGGKKVLEYGSNDFETIPFFCYDDRLIPFDLYEQGINLNDSVFKDLLPAQKEYNRLISTLSSSVERASKLKIAVPIGSPLDKKTIFEDSSASAIYYNPQYGRVEQLRLDPTPPMALPLKHEMERDLENISGVHEVSFGRLPERASHASGVLVNLLLEQDDSLLDPLISEVDESVFSPAWSFLLKLVQENYIEPRLIKLVGRDKEEAVTHFKGADLRGNTDVFVSTNTSLPKSRALRTEWIIRIAELGLIKDPKTILELLEFGEAKRVYEDELIHEKRAIKENYEIETGAIIDISHAEKMLYFLDDDITHLKIHLRDRLSTKYDNYNDLQKNVLEAHIQLHLQRLQQAAAQQQQPAGGQPKSIPEEAPQQPPAAGQAGAGAEGNIEEF